MALDVLLLVPFEPATASSIDSGVRQTAGARLSLPIAEATAELEEHLGRSLDFWQRENRPRFGGEPMPFPAHRSLTAVALATQLERAGLAWQAIDPAVRELRYWRRRLLELKSQNPLTVALSTTFIMSAPWLRALCTLIRQILPQSKLLVGGYYYATNARKFLSLDADVFCVGEGDVRLPQIVKAIRDRAPLDNIPGLYLRNGGGHITFTGPAEPLDMKSLPKVDWSVASRIDPPIDLERDPIEFGVETQRGCFFKCEFCTYRTLASLSMMPPSPAVDAILGTAASPIGYINVADSTATFPHDRWEQMLRLLIERGGSPHPIWAFARVSDISSTRAELMAKAGIRQVFIGQESGDQRMLNLMKKGTRVDQVKPAIAHLGQNGIGATFGFFHGFPGETEQSLAATRSLIASLNDQCVERPVALIYLLYPFIYMDFASVSRNEAFQNVDHYLGYESGNYSAQRAVDEVLETFIRTSRIPHAPAYAFLFESAPATSGIAVFSSPHKYEIFHWLKAVERGVAIFLEARLEGRRPNPAELRAIRQRVLERYPVSGIWRAQTERVSARLRRALATALKREWLDEREHGPGRITRALLAFSAWRDTGKLAYDAATPSVADTGVNAEIDVLADSLISDAIARGAAKKSASLVALDR